jgi:hypothetical protein
MAAAGFRCTCTPAPASSDSTFGICAKSTPLLRTSTPTAMRRWLPPLPWITAFTSGATRVVGRLSTQ